MAGAQAKAAEPFTAPLTWTFESDKIAGAFDDHVREQLPWYDIATFATRILGTHYLPRGGRAYDIGAGNGNMARAFAEEIAARDIDWTSIESSPNMAKAWNAPGRLLVADCCDVPYSHADLVTSFLTLVFIPPARRNQLIAEIIGHLRPGGAFICVERMIPDAGYPSLACARLTLAQKAKQGARPEDIYAKEMSLIGIQRRLGPKLSSIATHYEWFRLGPFAGFIFEKPEAL